MRSYRYLHLDVFTDRLFGGNQLAVVLDGRGLDAEAMLAIAKEMNFSETTFVLPAERSDTGVRVRIFTPAEELPMAGHPTIGTAFALARTGVLAPGLERIVFGLGVGPTDVDLVWNGKGLAFAWMTQRPPVFGDPVADRAGAAASLGLAAAALGDSRLPVQSVSCGVPYLMVPLATREAVDAAALDAREYAAFRSRAGLDHLPVFLFTTERSGTSDADAYCRMFAPGLGVHEDPATGSACGPLGCYLVRYQAVPAGRAGELVGEQGVKMGRPSTIHIAIGQQNGAIGSVRVGGTAVLAGEGTLYI